MKRNNKNGHKTTIAATDEASAGTSALIAGKSLKEEKDMAIPLISIDF